MLVRKFSPFLYQNFPHFGFDFFPFFCHLVAVESVFERADPTLLFKTPFRIHFLPRFSYRSYPRFSYHSYPHFSYCSYLHFSFHAYSSFSYHAYSLFSYSCYPRFSYHSYPRFSYTSYPRFSYPNRLIEHTVDAAKGHRGTVAAHTLFYHHQLSSEDQEEGVFTSISGSEYRTKALKPNYV